MWCYTHNIHQASIKMQCWYGEDMDEDCRIGSTHPNIPPDKHAAYPGDGAEPQEEGA